MNGRAHRTLAEKVLMVMYVIALIVVLLFIDKEAGF